MFQRSDVRESERHQRWNFQGARLGNMAQRVAARIAVLLRIGQRSNPNAVQHDPDHAVKLGHESLAPYGVSGHCSTPRPVVGIAVVRAASPRLSSSGGFSAHRRSSVLLTPVFVLFMAD